MNTPTNTNMIKANKQKYKAPSSATAKLLPELQMVQLQHSFILHIFKALVLDVLPKHSIQQQHELPVELLVRGKYKQLSQMKKSV